MAICTRHATTQELDLDGFLEVANKIDFRDFEAVQALGEQLTMLGNNRRFLTEFMDNYIQQHLDAHEVQGTISQAVILGHGEQYYARMAFWLTEAEVSGAEAQLYAYDQAHDHNFDLLSYAYCGSGYTTDLYEYDYGSVAGYVGEEVALTPLGKHQHRVGDVLLYRCSKDIHFQRPPATPSITLNVISLLHHHGLVDQYFFDICAPDSAFGTISRFADTNMEARRTLLDILTNFPTARTSADLERIVESYPCPRTRYEAIRSLMRVDRVAHDDLVRRVDAKHPLMRRHLRSLEQPA